MVADDGMGMSFDMEHERDRLPRNYEEEPREREYLLHRRAHKCLGVESWMVGWEQVFRL